VSLDRYHKSLTVFLTGSLVLLFLSILPSGTVAALDAVETYDSTQFILPVSVFGDGAMVYVLASDGVSSGGNVSVSVFDEGDPFDQITIILFDDGTGPGDIPNDGEYTGNFTIRFDGGISGTFTEDLSDIIDLADGGLATIIVDIDGLEDSGFTQVIGDFSIPQVTINSVSETVDASYTLNATVTDMNADRGNVWYRVDGRPNQRFYYAGGNDYETVVDTSALLNGSHTIRIIAYDLAGNLNNTEAITIDVLHPQPPAPDLSISITVSPPNPKAGDTVTITATIENTGDADASDVTVTFYVGTEIVYETTETIPAGETQIVEGTWTSEEGDHGARVEVSSPTMAPVTSSIQTFEVQPAGSLLDIFKNPWVILVLIVIIAAIMIGGTVGWAYLGKEMAKAKPSEVVPVTPVAVPPEGKDPCEEIRRKWKAIVAEYERSLAEMEGAQRRAWNLRDVADEARSKADKARREADDADKSVAEARVKLERAKRQMHDFFAKSIYVDGISVGTPAVGEPNHIGYFKGLVKVYFRGESSGEILSKFVKDNREAYDELQDEYDDSHRDTAQLESQAAAANQMATQAEAEATATENQASAAEQEYENLKNEVRNLKEKSEAFREKWRVCNLERLRDAAEEAERAAAEAEEAARNAQNADSASELEEHKKETEDAKEKVEDAKGEAEKIKKKLQEEGMDEGLEEYDDVIRRASRSAASAVQAAAGAGSLFRPDPSNLGKPCRGGETRVLNEYTMRYQLFDPTREITMPYFYGVQSAGEAGKAFADYLKNVGEICGRIKDVIGELPGGDLVGIPLDYWATIMDAGGAALRKISERPGLLGYIKMSGLAIPTIQVTVTCQEIMVCREGTWQKERKKVSETAPVRSQIGYPHDIALPSNEAIEWVRSRLESLSTQQRNYQGKPCG